MPTVNEKFKAKMEELKAMPESQLVTLVVQAEALEDETGAAAKLTGNTTRWGAAKMICAALCEELERRHPEVSEVMDEWAMSTDPADEVSYVTALLRAIRK